MTPRRPERRPSVGCKPPAAIAGCLGALALVVSGCGLEYYFELAGGALGSLARMRPVDLVQFDPFTPQATRAQLQFVGEVRAFAIEQLGLLADASYTFYDDDLAFLDHDRVGHILFASARDGLTPFLWEYPFFGSAAYRGFFSFDSARHEQAALEAAGYDTYVGTMTGFSSLAMLPVPIRASQLRLDDPDLVAFLLHEMTHPTIVRPGDTFFNESVAEFVGRNGARRFFVARFGADATQTLAALQRYADRDLIDESVQATLTQLAGFYARPIASAEKLAGRAAEFAAAAERFETEYVPRLSEPDRYARYGDPTPNNAFFQAFGYYRGNHDVFARVLDALDGDLRAAVALFRRAAAAPDGFGWLTAWLEGGVARHAPQPPAAAPNSATPTVCVWCR